MDKQKKWLVDGHMVCIEFLKDNARQNIEKPVDWIYFMHEEYDLDFNEMKDIMRDVMYEEKVAE